MEFYDTSDQEKSIKNVRAYNQHFATNVDHD